MNERPDSNRGSQTRPPELIPKDARGVAFAVLNLYRQRKASSFVSPLLDRHCTEAGLSPADRGLAAEMVHNVVRRQATLDALIEPRVSRPRLQVEPELWTLLQLGACQLSLMSSIPPHAAVNETVEVANRCGKRRWSGMINGVLRAISRNLTEEIVDGPAADAVPLTAGLYRKLCEPVFPDPSADFGGYVSQAFSFPRWLVEGWLSRFDEREIRRLAFWFNTPTKPHLRVNFLRTDRDTVLNTLRENGIAASPGALAESIHLAERTPIDALPSLQAGWFTIQDESAMFAVDLLDPQPEETVLDLCAAPGTKTTHLAERMHNSGRIIAADVNADRLLRVEENCRRLGVSIVRTTTIDRDGANFPNGPFDAILVDAPCSNTGVLGKRPEVRWRLGAQDIQELAILQRRLLTAACDRLKPGGRIVYSTCSNEPEENAEVVTAVVGQQPGFRVADRREHIPGQPADGGCQTLIRRD
jgi:16S rRNA (cytosine967-C5)-methyltransferase